MNDHQLSPEALRPMLDLAPSLVGYIGPDLRYRFANDRYAEVLGQEPRTIVGKQVAEVVGQAAYATLYPYIRRAMAGERVDYEQWVELEGGNWRFWSTTYQPHIDKGQVDGFFVYATDTTEKKRAEEAMEESERRFRAIFDNAAVGMARIGLAGEWLDVNDRLCNKLGYTRGELMNLPVEEITHPDDREQTVQGALALLSDEGRHYQTDKRYLRKDGSIMWGHLTASLVRSEHNDPLYIVALIENIDARKRAEEAMAASESKYRGVFENARVGMARVGPDGQWLDVNNQICAELGYSREELLRLTFQDVTHPDDLEEDMRQAERLLRGEIDHHEMDKRYVRKDGSEFWAHLTASSVRDANGAVEYFVSVMENITARKQAEEALQEMTRTLESRIEERTSELLALNQELDSFNYTVSHDLRAPLRGIDGFSQALLEEYGGRLDGSGREYIAKVSAAVTRMSELIDALLMLSRLTREFEAHPVDLSEIAREIASGLQRESPERQAEFVIEGGLTVCGDERLLRTMMRNLLENAWKMTRNSVPARVEVGASVGEGENAFFVRDNGAGFDPQYADRLFRPFQRLHSTKEFEGQGIGLATVKRVIQRHGGQVWAEATVGEGATFYFTLPGEFGD